MRLIFTLLSIFIALTCNAKISIDEKIINTNSKLKTFNKSTKNIHSSMAKNAKAILKQNRTILKQQRELEKLRAELKEKNRLYEQNKKELSLLKTSQDDLQTAQNEIEQKLAFAIAKNASLSLLLTDERAKNAQSLITEEALKILCKQTEDKIKNLQSSHSGNDSAIKILKSRISDLRTSIALIDSKEHKLALAVDENNRALKKLNEETKAYQKELNRLLQGQKNLKKTLARLNIIKKEKIKEKKDAKRKRLLAQKKEREQEILKAKKEQENFLADTKNLPKVKQLGSSYQRIKTKRYRGKKTISPLDGYSVTKKFGPYTDPIYNIKIFNESVSLKPKNANAKVKNILNGKVVMAQEMAMLDNVVIVEHKNGLHTIYAHLDKIAPSIKKGKKIRKGSIIGRVNKELMLEVTQKNYHINPLQLIN